MIIDTRAKDPRAAAPPADPVVEGPPDLVDPTTGEVLDRKDVDALIAARARIDRQYTELGNARKDIAFHLAALTTGEAKTRRIIGRERAAKVEMPDDSWEQSVLKEAWNAYPQFRDTYLKIGVIDVRLREFKKLLETAGPADFTQFKSMLVRANRGPSGTPRITIEK